MDAEPERLAGGHGRLISVPGALLSARFPCTLEPTGQVSRTARSVATVNQRGVGALPPEAELWPRPHPSPWIPRRHCPRGARAVPEPPAVTCG